MYKKNNFKKPLCIAFPPHEPCPPTSPIGNFICNKVCGNIFLNNQVSNLEIWKEEIPKKATITISVFNSNLSTSSIKITIVKNNKNPVELIIPSGNTSSATIDDAKSIIASQEIIGNIEGKYCLEICFEVTQS